MTKVPLGTSNGAPMQVNLASLLETRFLVQANSGAVKASKGLFA